MDVLASKLSFKEWNVCSAWFEGYCSRYKAVCLGLVVERPSARVIRINQQPYLEQSKMGRGSRMTFPFLLQLD